MTLIATPPPVLGPADWGLQATVVPPSQVDIHDFQATLFAEPEKLSTDAITGNQFGVFTNLSASLDNASDHLKNRVDAMGELAKNHANTNNTADLLQMQLQLTQLSIETQMMGEMVSKSTKNLDQLTHLQ
ncbi:EscI/YscI/HrpB family type III secretion system inner rod protein [Limnobacter alexandrii]|uniref:EscI/YscI/HrpB family type III secretion system inner rod protein n=1 Tax=Limnobacter alexandrii TaxID=2570352 RepID=UPI0011094347|nr:EscI/YscI/HrpB family type III secretion system inner rod protein [Limnobacter alexandrii]